MKSIVFWAAQVMLLLSSLLCGFVGSPQAAILCLSCLASSFLLLLVWACLKKKVWDLFFLGSSVLFVNGNYLSVATPWNQTVFLFMLLTILLALVFLFVRVLNPLRPKLTLDAVICAKAGLIPVILLNWLIVRTSGPVLFEQFSWFLLLYTSVFVLRALWQLYSEKKISSSWAAACGLLQFFFFTDLVGAVILRILAAKADRPAPEKKSGPKVYQSKSFSKVRAGRIHR